MGWMKIPPRAFSFIFNKVEINTSIKTIITILRVFTLVSYPQAAIIYISLNTAC